MATGSEGVVGAAGFSGEIAELAQVNEAAANAHAADTTGAAASAADTSGPADTFTGSVSSTAASEGLQNSPSMTGQGAQFVYAAATVANVLTNNLTATQINLLANFLSVVTTCVYAILTVENPTDILEA